jgi:hypothetical protein
MRPRLFMIQIVIVEKAAMKKPEPLALVTR